MGELEDDLRVLRIIVGVPCHQQRLVALITHHLGRITHQQPDQVCRGMACPNTLFGTTISNLKGPRRHSRAPKRVLGHCLTSADRAPALEEAHEVLVAGCGGKHGEEVLMLFC